MRSALKFEHHAQRRRAPALRAAVIQLIALAPTLTLGEFAARAGHPLPPAGAAVCQGVVAAVATGLLRLDPWWCAIQLAFPVALLEAYRLHVPPNVFLGISVVLVLLFWSTFRTQVPFYPSGRAVWSTLADLLPSDRSIRLIDIGSGLGGLVLDLARRNSLWQLSGIELAPLPWLLSVLRARVAKSAVRFVRGDYERLNFADYDVVFAYLSPAVMSALWRKAEAELRPGSMLISYEFDISARAPDRTVATAPSRPALFIWNF